MGKFRFRVLHLKKRIFKICKWVKFPNLRRRTPLSNYRRLDSPTTAKIRLEKWVSWERVKNRAKKLCSINQNPGHLRLGQNPDPVPKGHLAVYVGEKKPGSEELSRVFVPVMYFNHPLFGELLREAEEEFGYKYPGRITIPCRVEELNKVQTKIAAGKSCRNFFTCLGSRFS